jgi:hypothetical protein
VICPSRIARRAWCVSFSLVAALGVNADTTAFVDVNVVPMDRERVLRRQTVIVRDNAVVAVGERDRISVPADARLVEGHGTAYLLPGLADMHTHVEKPDDAALYAANGVTTVLHLGGDRMLPVALIRSGIADGTILSPQIFFSLKVDAPGASDGWPVDSEDAARLAVAVAKAQGHDFIKVYNQLRPQDFDALVDGAREAGLAVIGHGVRSVGLPASLFKGLVMVAHAEEFFYTTFAYTPDDARIASVVEEVFRSGAYVTPNLSTYEAIAQQWGKPEKVIEFLRDPDARLSTVESRLIWASQPHSRQQGDVTPTLEFLKRFTKALSDRGVPLLTGTDSPVIAGMVPGYSIHHDLRTLTDIGLTPFDALSAATRTPGEFIAKYVPRARRFGVVEQAARADLVLVAENPLESLDTLRRPLGVMLGGRWKTAEELSTVIEANKARHDSVLRELTQ